MININSKLPTSKESIFATMSRMAKEHNAINLSQGFPGYDIDPELIRLVNQYMQKGFNQYAPMIGLPELRTAVADMHEKAVAFRYHPDTEVTITAGGTQALYTAITALVCEGDEVIVFEPAYDSYVPAILTQGGKPIFVSMEFPKYQINWDEVSKRVTGKTKMMILNNPHNPTGAVLTETDLKALTKLLKGTNIVVLSDEVYQHITFDGKPHLSLASVPELRERTLIVGSFGKSLHATGWKIGYVLAPEYLSKHFRSFHQWVVFAVNTPIQYAIAEYIQNEQRYLGVSSFLQKKRDYFVSLMEPTKFKAIPSHGTYFQLMDYTAISNLGDVEFSQWLTKEHRVATIPVSVFYHEKTDHKVVRFCFAKDDAELEKAAELLKLL